MDTINLWSRRSPRHLAPAMSAVQFILAMQCTLWRATATWGLGPLVRTATLRQLDTAMDTAMVAMVATWIWLNHFDLLRQLAMANMNTTH